MNATLAITTLGVITLLTWWNVYDTYYHPNKKIRDSAKRLAFVAILLTLITILSIIL